MVFVVFNRGLHDTHYHLFLRLIRIVWHVACKLSIRRMSQKRGATEETWRGRHSSTRHQYNTRSFRAPFPVFIYSKEPHHTFIRWLMLQSCVFNNKFEFHFTIMVTYSKNIISKCELPSNYKSSKIIIWIFYGRRTVFVGLRFRFKFLPSFLLLNFNFVWHRIGARPLLGHIWRSCCIKGWH